MASKPTPSVLNSCLLWGSAVSVAALCFVLYRDWRQEKEYQRIRLEREEEEKRGQVSPRASWNEDEISKFKGKDKGPILLAIDGKVFNVSMRRDLYGPGGSYQALAGKDASLLLAKGSLEDGKETKGADLSEEEKRALGDWKNYFEGSYEYVGPLVHAL